MKNLPFVLQRDEWYALEVFGSGRARQQPHHSPILLRSVRRSAGERDVLTLSYLEANDLEGAEEKICRLHVLQHTSSHLAATGPDDGQLMVIFPLEDAWLQTHFPGVDRLMHAISG